MDLYNNKLLNLYFMTAHKCSPESGSPLGTTLVCARTARHFRGLRGTNSCFSCRDYTPILYVCMYVSVEDRLVVSEELVKTRGWYIWSAGHAHTTIYRSQDTCIYIYIAISYIPHPAHPSDTHPQDLLPSPLFATHALSPSQLV